MELERALVSDERIVRGRLADDDRAGAAHQLRQRSEVLRANAAVLLRRSENERDARRSFELACKRTGRDEHRRDARLHVGGAAAVQAVAVGFAAECVVHPFTRAERHDVEVTGEDERRLRIRSARARNEAGAAFSELVVLDAVAPFRQQRTRAFGAFALRAGRVDGLELQQRARELDGVGGHQSATSKGSLCSALTRMMEKPRTFPFSSTFSITCGFEVSRNVPSRWSNMTSR